MLTVSPNRQYLGILLPTTPPTTGPVSKMIIRASQLVISMDERDDDHWDSVSTILVLWLLQREVDIAVTLLKMTLL